MNLKKFIKKVYPPVFIFSRKDKGFIWKLSKWTGIRTAFIFYKLGISANFLNVITYLIIALAFYFIFKIQQSLIFQPIIGLFLLYLCIWFDFVDGSIARANNKSSKIGHYLDEFGMALCRLIIIILLGSLSGIKILQILSIISGFIIVELIPKTYKIIEFGKLKPIMIIFYNNPLSLISVRVMTIIIPLFLIVATYYKIDLMLVGIYGSSFYIFLAITWVLFCIPHYNNEKNVEDQIKEH